MVYGLGLPRRPGGTSRLNVNPGSFAIGFPQGETHRIVAAIKHPTGQAVRLAGHPALAAVPINYKLLEYTLAWRQIEIGHPTPSPGSLQVESRAEIDGYCTLSCGPPGLPRFGNRVGYRDDEPPDIRGINSVPLHYLADDARGKQLFQTSVFLDEPWPAGYWLLRPHAWVHRAQHALPRCGHRD
jgi:hypothetical protein